MVQSAAVEDAMVQPVVEETRVQSTTVEDTREQPPSNPGEKTLEDKRQKLRSYPAGRLEKVRMKWKKLITKLVEKDTRA